MFITGKEFTKNLHVTRATDWTKMREEKREEIKKQYEIIHFIM